MENEITTQKSPRLEMLGLLSRAQNCLVLYDLLREKKIDDFFDLLKTGYALNAFILNCMIDNGYESRIKEAMKNCQRHDNDIYEFLVAYMGKDEAEKYFVELGFKNLIIAKFSNDDLEKHQLWDIFLQKGDFYFLLKHEQIDYFKKALKEDIHVKKMLDSLLLHSRADILLALEKKEALRDFEKGRKKLLELKEWEIILKNFKAEKSAKEYGFENDDAFYQYILDNGGMNAVYETYEGKNFLAGKNIFQPFIEDKNWFWLAYKGFFNKVDWQNYYQKDKKSALEYAERGKQWWILEENKCRWKLFINFRWIRFLRTFTN